MSNRSAILTLTAVLLTIVLSNWRSDSQQPAPPSEKNAPAGKADGKSADTDEEKTREINIKADRAKYNNKTGITTFVGKVAVTQVGEKFTMTADTVDYEEKTDSAKGYGNLTFTDPDTTITGKEILANFGEKRALITGSVKLTSHGKATKEEPQKNKEKKTEPLKEQYKKKKTTMDCDQIEYFYSEGKANATGNLKFSQEEKKGTALKATYLDDEQQIILEGDVDVVNDKGEKLRCRKAIIYIDEDNMDAEGVEAVLIRKEKKPEKGKGAAASGKAEEKAAPADQDKTQGKTSEGEKEKGQAENQPAQ